MRQQIELRSSTPQNTAPETQSDGTEIVDAEKDFTPEQDEVIKNVHKHIAALIPQPGRDYTITFNFPNGDANLVNISLQGHTKSGIAFVDIIKNYLEENE